jgi:hypothetical protein
LSEGFEGGNINTVGFKLSFGGSNMLTDSFNQTWSLVHCLPFRFYNIFSTWSTLPLFAWRSRNDGPFATVMAVGTTSSGDCEVEGIAVAVFTNQKALRIFSLVEKGAECAVMVVN